MLFFLLVDSSNSNTGLPNNPIFCCGNKLMIILIGNCLLGTRQEASTVIKTSKAEWCPLFVLPCACPLLLPSWCFTPTETIRLIRDGQMDVGEEGDFSQYLSLHCHHQDDPCIKTGSDESHFDVSLIVRDKVHKPQPFWREGRAEVESKWNRAEALLLTALPLGQTGSLYCPPKAE